MICYQKNILKCVDRLGRTMLIYTCTGRGTEGGHNMTKTERKALQEYINKMTGYRVVVDIAFKELQDLNEKEGTGHRWCCADQNYKDLLSVGKDYTNIYNRYVQYNGMIDALNQLGNTLAELNFWK